MKSILHSVLIFFIQITWLNAQEVNVIDIKGIKEIDNLTFERLYDENWFNADSIVLESIYTQPNSIKRFTEDEIKTGLQKIPSAIPLQYNYVVKQYIEYFSIKRRKDLSIAMGLGSYYFPIFEEALYKHGAPLQLKYLPIIESDMNPFAKSYAGAQGMWQIMLRTGKMLGLNVNDYYDERRDPIVSTEAAAKYLSKLNTIYDDWLLTLAAYNAGPGNVNKAIARANGKRDYWEIRPFLPKETQNYIPKLIALIFVMYHVDEYNLLPLKPENNILVSDTFQIYDKISLRYIVELSGVDSSYLHFINPALKMGIIPKNDEGFVLHIPINYVGHFEALKPFFKDDPYLKDIEAEVKEPKIPKHTVYKVKSGDTLGHIGERYNVGVSQIKEWNNLKSDRLKIGQKLIILK